MAVKMYSQAVKLRRNEYLPEGAATENADIGSVISNREELETAAHSGAILEAMCQVCDCGTMSLHVELPCGIHGIIPKSEAGFNPAGDDIKDIAVITRVGKAVQFKIIELYENERGETTAVLSRKSAQREVWERYVKALVPGDIVPARVTHLEPFGAFCDIGGGIVSLLTVDRISVSRISHPSDRFMAGDNIEVVIASTDDSRIYLTHRELLGTWEENAAGFESGQTVTGIIRSVEDYGVFVELTPNLAGLAEVSDGVTVGDSCSVYIKSLIPSRMKIKLVLIDTCGKAPVMPCRYYIDTKRVGHIERWVYSPEASSKVIETDFSLTGECERAIR